MRPPRDEAQDATTKALRAEHQEAVQRRDEHRRAKYFTPELDIILDGQVTDLRKRLDASKPAADVFNGHLKIIEKAEAQAVKVGKQLQAAWATVANSTDTAKALEDKHRLALEHVANLRASTAAKADAAGTKAPEPMVLAAVDALRVRVEEERATSAKLGRGRDTDDALAKITANICQLHEQLAAITTVRDAAGDTPMGGTVQRPAEPRAPAPDPSGNGAVPPPVQDPSGNCTGPLGSTAQPVAPLQPTATQAAQLVAAADLLAAHEQQQAAQQQLLDAQQREQQSVLEHQNQQLHQQLVQAAATANVEATAPATLPASQPVGENVEDRARLMQTALLLSGGLADDTEAIVEARAALRGRMSQAAGYGPAWLQDGIDMFHRTLQQAGAPLTQGTEPADQPSAKTLCTREPIVEDPSSRTFPDTLDT